MSIPFLLTEADLFPPALVERKRCFDIVVNLIDEEREREFKKGNSERDVEKFAEAVMMLTAAAVDIQGLGRTEILRRTGKA